MGDILDNLRKAKAGKPYGSDFLNVSPDFITQESYIGYFDNPEHTNYEHKTVEEEENVIWINVKKFLPPQSKGYTTSKWVLVTVKTSKNTKFICMGRYSYESNHWDISNYEYGITPVYLNDKYKITAWADVDPFID